MRIETPGEPHGDCGGVDGDSERNDPVGTGRPPLPSTHPTPNRGPSSGEQYAPVGPSIKGHTDLTNRVPNDGVPV